MHTWGVLPLALPVADAIKVRSGQAGNPDSLWCMSNGIDWFIYFTLSLLWIPFPLDFSCLPCYICESTDSHALHRTTTKSRFINLPLHPIDCNLSYYDHVIHQQVSAAYCTRGYRGMIKKTEMGKATRPEILFEARSKSLDIRANITVRSPRWYYWEVSTKPQRQSRSSDILYGRCDFWTGHFPGFYSVLSITVE